MQEEENYSANFYTLTNWYLEKINTRSYVHHNILLNRHMRDHDHRQIQLEIFHFRME